MSALVISLDFEMFWGVADCATIRGYGRNVEGVWQAVPALLSLFRRYQVRATWATVGMAMCRDFRHWHSLMPALMPGYRDARLSTYRHGALAREYPRLFFGRPLVERIIDTPGQELASHTYSHFLCAEEGATPRQFAADLACARHVAADFGVQPRSLVLPRNQVDPAFLAMLPGQGMAVVRGNRGQWLYRGGHRPPGGPAGRALRYADAWLPLLPSTTWPRRLDHGLTDVPASLFLRPWSAALAGFEALRLRRLCTAMSAAARQDGIFHLWWHPHNFGVNLGRNLAMLEGLLRHYAHLRKDHDMCSLSMGQFADYHYTRSAGAHHDWLKWTRS